MTTKEECLRAIEHMPASEIKYYLLLTIKVINNEELHQDFLEKLKEFSENLCNLMMNSENDENYSDLLCQITENYQDLINLSQTNKMGVKVGYVLLNVAAAFCAFLTGFVGVLIGGFGGLIRGFWNLRNPSCPHGISHFLWVGIATGIMLGAAIGFRAPKKLFKDELTRQLKFCMDGITACMEKIEAEQSQFLSSYEDEVKIKFFNRDGDAYNEFLASDQIYEITTVSAQFMSDTLEGYIGHHALIKITIPDQEPILLELSTKACDLEKRKPIQHDERTVTGKKIVEMMAFHEQLKLSNGCSLKQIKPGDNDCFSYVNKILTGTSQDATTTRRFYGDETRIGKRVGLFVEKLSPFRPDILDETYRSAHCHFN